MACADVVLGHGTYLRRGQATSGPVLCALSESVKQASHIHVECCQTALRKVSITLLLVVEWQVLQLAHSKRNGLR